jgi:hypothetical protein
VERFGPTAEGEEGLEIYAYQVVIGDGVTYVLWVEDGVGQVMGEAKPALNLTLPASSSVVTVTHVITQTGQTEPRVDIIEITGGQVVLRVNESPVYVEGIEPQQVQTPSRVYLPLVLKGKRGS